jgi:orotidine-5'-phosphate decarboxylase
MVNPILVALDVPSAAGAMGLAKSLALHVGGFKVGLELVMGEGPAVVDQVCGLGLPVFVDAKLHDIPNTVAGAARGLGSHGARWVTVHAAGGSEMMRAAVDALEEASDGYAGALAVTMLTSVDEMVLAESGITRSLADQVGEMAALAAKSGCEGVICSVHEVGVVRKAAPDLIAVTPGIRPAGVDANDQKRVSTPEEAISAGADYIVVGRAITGADDPVGAAQQMSSLIERLRWAQRS